MSIDLDVRVGLAAELDALAPGVGLVAALEDLPPAALAGEDLASYVRARWRVHNRATAELLEGLQHLGRAEAGCSERRASSDEFSGDEVSALLGWSRTMAGRKLDLADDLFGRLPEVGEALYGGWLDEPKARTVCDWTRDLADDHAHEVCRLVLPEAPALPVGALIERIEQVAKSLDPDWAERRRTRAEARAQVILSSNPSGTSTLSLRDAPTPAGITSQARIDALAAAVRHLGVLTPIGPLRLHVATRLLDGSTAGMDDRAVALLLAAEYHAQNTPPDPDDGTDDSPEDGDPEDDGGPDDHRPDGSPDGNGPDDHGPDDDGPDDDGPDDDGPDDDGLDEGPDDGPDNGPRAAEEPGSADDDLVPALPAPRSPSEQPDLDVPNLPASPAAAGPLEPAVPLDPPDTGPGRIREGLVEIRLRLSTALGLDQHPATVPGYGTVLPHDALTMIMRRLDGEWRVVLTDPQGRLEHVLLARRRPGPRDRYGTRGRAHTRSIVELQVPTTLLAALDPDAHGSLGTTARRPPARLTELGRPGTPPDDHADAHERARRRPGAELDRWIRVRDRHCVAPGCRRPAHKADLDHTLDHALGGPTSSWNLGAWCPHDHRAKHHAGWQVRQPSPALRHPHPRRDHLHHPSQEDPRTAPRPATRRHAPRPLPDDGWHDTRDDIDPDRHQKIAPTQKTRPTVTTTPTRGSYDEDEPPF